MTTYVLVVLLYYQRAGFTAEFSSKEKCENAGQMILADATIGYQTKYYCMEK